MNENEDDDLEYEEMLLLFQAENDLNDQKKERVSPFAYFFLCHHFHFQVDIIVVVRGW